MTLLNKKYKVDRTTYKDGYAIVKNLAPIGLIDALIEEIEFLIANKSKDWIDMNSAKTSRDEFVVIRSIDTPSDLIFSLGRDSTLLDLSEEFAEKKVTPMYSEYFSKPPLSKCPTPVHQDQAFYEAHFNDELGVTFWIALDDCNSENGCMFVKPNRNRILNAHKKSEEIGFGYEMDDQSKEGFLEIPLKKGDALIHSAYTPHFCPSNRTDNMRRAIAVTFRTSQYREENKS